MRTFREYGIKGLVASGGYDRERGEVLQRLWAEDTDADPLLREIYPWLREYQTAGRQGLERYLGTPEEIDFDEINRIVAAFKNGERRLTVKRMGRGAADIWYDDVDVSDTRALIVEWTHGNSEYLHGIDIPVMIDAVPEETVEYRRKRNRDGACDSPFTAMVLEIEQRALNRRAAHASLIVGTGGDIIPYDAYCAARGLEPEALDGRTK